MAAEKSAETDDACAFAALCERHRARLWRLVHSLARDPAEADDLAQEAIVRAFEARRAYRPDAPFEAWLCRIALHAAHDRRRSAWARRVFSLDSVPASREADGERPDAAAVRRDSQRRTRAAVAALPVRQRVPVWLHFFEQFSLAEISRLEAVPESTVRSRLAAGLKRLRIVLEDDEPL